MEIVAENVAQALPKAVRYLQYLGVQEESRAGKVLVLPGPVLTKLIDPAQRVLFSAVRDANPFFHLVEALWMLAGRDDAAPLNEYVRDFGERFAELRPGAEVDGRVHGAYGHRWRTRWGDQLNVVVRRLRDDLGTRQCVLQMWDCNEARDLTEAWRDRPCNTHVYTRIREGKLELTACSRSHDVAWGLLGANAVHFSVLQEYLAARLGVGVGPLYFLSNNFHVYAGFLDKLRQRSGGRMFPESMQDDRYWKEGIKPLSMFDAPDSIDEDVDRFFKWHDGTGTPTPYSNLWFSRTAERAVTAYRLHKSGSREDALTVADGIEAPDWRLACREWIERRIG